MGVPLAQRVVKVSAVFIERRVVSIIRDGVAVEQLRRVEMEYDLAIMRMFDVAELHRRLVDERPDFVKINTELW